MPNKAIGIVYHFFAHYREPVIRELLASSHYDYWLLGDNVDPLNNGIKSASIIDSPRFIYTRSTFLGRYLFQQGVLKFALRKDIDSIIYLGDPQFISTWFSAILAKLSGKKIYFWTHGWIHPDSWLKGIIRSTYFRLANGGLLLYGTRSRQTGIEKGFDPNRLYVIYNSLNYERCKKIRLEVTPVELELVKKENFINSNLPMIICCSRLVKERRLDLLLEALGLLISWGYEVNTLIVGEGTERAELEKRASEMALSVKFFGECYDEKTLGRMYMASDITVVPNFIGLTCIHSLSYGTPVISNDNPEMNGPEWEAIKVGKTGDRYHFGDVTDLAEKIRLWTQIDTEKDVKRYWCIRTVEEHYTPKTQQKAIEFALSGKPAS